MGPRISCRRITRASSFARLADPVLYVNNPAGVERADRRAMLDALGGARAAAIRRRRTIPEILSRVSQYEMAYRMQASVPGGGRHLRRAGARARHVRPRRTQARDLRAQLPDRAAAGRARREVPDAVRAWAGTTISRSSQSLPVRCKEIDQPSAALVMDLKQRGLLDDTLVMFGGEFGRTPFAPGPDRQPARRPRPPRRLLHRVAGRRRRQGRSSRTARPTTSATTS